MRFFGRKANATRRPDNNDPRNPPGTTLRRFERDGRNAILAAFVRLHRALFRNLPADAVPAELPRRLNDPEYTQDLADVIQRFTMQVALAGADFGRVQVETLVLGVKAHTPQVKAHTPQQPPRQEALPVDSSPDWEGANTAAAEYARQYAATLVSDILETTRERIRTEVAAFTENKETVNQLRDRLSPLKNEAGSPFGKRRAELIAVTETTRMYAQANAMTWERSGVVEGREWRTNTDELVCPICGGMDGVVAKLGENFQGTYNGDNPPAHPKCRCWTVPVGVIDQEALENERRLAAEDRQVEQDILIELAERYAYQDPLDDILPPEGERAPRGEGKQWQARRWIHKNIKQQEAYKQKAKARADTYRGQADSHIIQKRDEALDRYRQLTKASDTMREIALDPHSTDWVFKRELIESIIQTVRGEEALRRYERNAARNRPRTG